MRPLCFVLMPFGTKKDGAGKEIDFNAVYSRLIAPAIERAGLEPLRADEEMTGGIIHKPMFERLLLCEYAVADLTTANANVFYELGVRHAKRRQSTALIFADTGARLPFDLAPLRALPYSLNSAGLPDRIDQDIQALSAQLEAAKQGATDSPLYQLLDDYPDIQHTKTDVFRDLVAYGQQIKKQLSSARKEGLDTLKKIENSLGEIKNVEAGILVDLFLSYRSVSAWREMVELAERMSPVLSSTVMIREQYGFALNRMGRREEAEEVLKEVIAKHGPSSETYGLLGRVYKDSWEDAVRDGSKIKARGYLTQAIDAYLKGFEADWRDAYPGVNAVSLMELCEPPDERRKALLPVVTYAVERRIATGNPDYWDHATLLELAVLQNDKPKALDALAAALPLIRAKWEPETTLRNIRLIRETREQRGEETTLLTKIEGELSATIA